MKCTLFCVAMSVMMLWLLWTEHMQSNLFTLTCFMSTSASAGACLGIDVIMWSIKKHLENRE